MDNIFTNTEATQINLFDYLKKTGRLQVQKKTFSSELPKKIKEFTGSMSFEDLVRFVKEVSGKTYVVMYKGNRYAGYYRREPEYFDYIGETQRGSELRGSICPEQAESVIAIKVHRFGRSELKGILMYVTEGGTVYEAETILSVEDCAYDENSYYVKSITLSKWKKARLHSHKLETVLNAHEAAEILQRVNPYGSDFMKDLCLEAVDMLIAPQMEQLDKAGYRLVRNSLIPALSAYDDTSTLEQFNRLCQPGKNMKEIFKTSKAVYITLKECVQLATWDIYRKMDKQGKISADAIERCYNGNYSEKEMNEINSILGNEYDGKKVFTWDSLQKYLERIDMYEAIDRYDGLILLRDYLSMCRQLEMKPRIDGDSLKREHDVTARTLRQKRDEIRAGKMVGVCEDNKKYDYSEHIYFGRCIRSYDDLIDEATQQHNCVASYADSIIAKRSYIFVVREMSHPEKSLATVEITPTGKIRQKFLAYNRPIHNKALTEFIERLARNFIEVKATSIHSSVA